MNKELQAFKKRFSFEEYCKTDLEFWEIVNNRVEDLPGEEWREIPGWCCFEVSNFGRVKRPLQERCYGGNTYPVLYAEKLLKPYYDKKGYAQVTLKQFGRRGTFYVHRLVADAFDLPYNSPDDVFVNHKDQTPNNNRLDNLERASVHYNNNYGTRNQRLSKTRKEHFGKMTAKERKDYMRPAIEANRKKIICGDVIYNSLSEFCKKWSLRLPTVSRWLNGTNAMPQEWRKKGLQYK